MLLKLWFMFCGVTQISVETCAECQTCSIQGQLPGKHSLLTNQQQDRNRRCEGGQENAAWRVKKGSRSLRSDSYLDQVESNVSAINHIFYCVVRKLTIADPFITELSW